jgi:hypothetical protein
MKTSLYPGWPDGRQRRRQDAASFSLADVQVSDLPEHLPDAIREPGLIGAWQTLSWHN